MIGGYNFLFSHGLAVDLRNARSDYWHVHIYYACALKFDNAIFFSGQEVFTCIESDKSTLRLATLQVASYSYEIFID